MSDAPAPTRAEEGRETDWLGDELDVSEATVESLRKEAEALVVLYHGAKARAAQAEAEVARLTAALKLCLTEMDWQIESTNRCGDPNYECPLQDIQKPSDSHAEARRAARTALKAPRADGSRGTDAP